MFEVVKDPGVIGRVRARVGVMGLRMGRLLVRRWDADAGTLVCVNVALVTAPGTTTPWPATSSM